MDPYIIPGILAVCYIVCQYIRRDNEALMGTDGIVLILYGQSSLPGYKIMENIMASDNGAVGVGRRTSLAAYFI